jgi:N6-adenosine-specific RNA methylase IME4
MGRTPIRKKGAFSNAEKQKRWRDARRKERIVADKQAEVDAGIQRRAQVMASRVAASRRAEADIADRVKRRVLFLLALIDPPWDDSDDAYGEAGKGRAAANHYQTMTPAETKRRYPKLPLAPHALVYIWTTSQRLEQAMDLLKFYGCTYGGIAFVWDKVHPTKGRRHRQQAEFVIRGTYDGINDGDIGEGDFVIYGSKGKGLPVPPPMNKTTNLIRAARSGPHSTKPLAVIEMLERQYSETKGHRMEMFSREPRDGWYSVGNEGLEEAAE